MDAFFQLKSKPKSSDKKGSSKEHSSKTAPRLIPWVEKYRPKVVDDVAHQEEVVAVLKKSLQGADLPNLLFYGPPGTGKTSTILAVARELFGPELMKSKVLELNASDERGIQVVRDKVKNFAKRAVGSDKYNGKLCPPFKIVILDEADSMTTSAQAALRRTMETETKTTRFCLICNYISRIIEPLTSRCSKFRFKPLSTDILTSRLQLIADKEAVKCSPGVVEEIVRASGGDMRKSITYLQSAARLRGDEVVTENDIKEIAGWIPEHLVDNLLDACRKDSHERLELFIKELLLEGYSASQALDQLHDQVVVMSTLTDKQKSVITERMGLIGRRLMDGADEYLQLMDLSTVIMYQLCHA